jgi:hypothetical protein
MGYPAVMPQAAQKYEQRPQENHRQGFSRSHVSMGAWHWIKTAGILAPLVIGEFVKDPDRRWRYIRMASVATALVSEAMWSNRISKERDQCRDERDHGGR